MHKKHVCFEIRSYYQQTAVYFEVYEESGTESELL